MDAALASALGQVAEAAEAAREPWWIIGSAAMALHGAVLTVGDVDLLMSRSDAAELLTRCGVAPGPGSQHDRFRSDVFGQLRLGRYTVEVMGGFHVHDGAKWCPVVPASRVLAQLGHAELFVPSVADLVAMCRLFGRPKDAQREGLLLALDPPRNGEVAREA